MTPKEDFVRFEKFLDGLSDIEYQYWYETEATDKQKAIADQLGIREPLDENDAEAQIFGRRNPLRQFNL